MDIRGRKEAAQFLELLNRYCDFCEKLMACIPAGETLLTWDQTERAAAERQVADEVGLSLSQIRALNEADLRPMVEKTISLLHELSEEVVAFIRSLAPGRH